MSVKPDTGSPFVIVAHILQNIYLNGQFIEIALIFFVFYKFNLDYDRYFKIEKIKLNGRWRSCLAHTLSVREVCVQIPGRSSWHSVSNGSPPLRRSFGTV